MPNSVSLGPVVLMFFAGVGIPIMAALNADFGTRVGSPWAASMVLMAIGLVVVAVSVAINGLPSRQMFDVPWRDYLAGFLVAFYLLSITWAAPRIGLGNAVFLVLLGQICSAAAIDHFALFGALRTPITLQRGLGIACMAAGIALARRM